jgi:thiol:disulfide interchange protein
MEARAVIRDESVKLYGYVLLIAGAAIGATFFAKPPTLEMAQSGVGSPEFIETASLLSDENSWAAHWNSPTIPWRRYDEGIQEMAEKGKPGILVLQADWCLECRRYQRLFKNDSIVSFADDYVFILGDIDSERDLQRQYNLDGDYVPRTLALDPTGKPKLARTGGHPHLKYFVDPSEPGELANLLTRAR